MAKPSKIDRLPPEIREEVSSLRERGYTIDEILGHLRALDIPPEDQPSWSGLQRHISGLDKLAERLQHSRTISDALVRRLGDAPEGKQARLNIELMHSVVTDLVQSLGDHPEGEEGEAVTLSPDKVMFLAKALESLARAGKTDAETTLRLREVGAASLAAKDEAAGRPSGPDYQIPDNGRDKPIDKKA